MSHPIPRRTFLAASAALAGGVQVTTQESRANESENQSSQRPLIISTWRFGLQGNAAARDTLENKGTTLDAVEQGIRVVESLGGSSVGLSGAPNAAGYVQQDACIMHGPQQQAGSVAGVEGVVHPISVARKVMEETDHVMIVGEGARWFAQEQGLETIDAAGYEPKKDAWRKREQAAAAPAKKDADNHDTIALLVLGEDGTISGGCSTSGRAGKLPGRVGDSPIIGSGLYVDNEVGAAGATGVGENVMRYCGTFLIVELMRGGLAPAEACRQAIDRIASVDPRGRKLDISFVALDKQGRFGAASTGKFPYAVTYPGVHRVYRV